MGPCPPRPPPGRSARRVAATRSSVARCATTSPATDSFTSAQQVYDDLRTSGDRVGLATVYRTLQAMAEAGEVDTFRTDDGETLFRKCGPRHHHHLVCRSCGVTVEIDGPECRALGVQGGRDHGFSDVTHVVELFGFCPACTKARSLASAHGSTAQAGQFVSRYAVKAASAPSTAVGAALTASRPAPCRWSRRRRR